MGCVSSKSKAKVTPVGSTKPAKVKLASQPVHIKEAWGMTTNKGTAEASTRTSTTPVSLFTKSRGRSSEDSKSDNMLAAGLKDSGVSITKEESAEEYAQEINCFSEREEMGKVTINVVVSICLHL